VPQLVQTKRLGEDVGNLPIRRNISQFDFTGEDSLLDKMIVHFDVLSPCVKNRVFCELDAAEVVAINHRQIRHLLM
jgi:hypothetical protein